MKTIKHWRGQPYRDCLGNYPSGDPPGCEACTEETQIDCVDFQEVEKGRLKNILMLIGKRWWRTTSFEGDVSTKVSAFRNEHGDFLIELHCLYPNVKLGEVIWRYYPNDSVPQKRVKAEDDKLKADAEKWRKIVELSIPADSSLCETMLTKLIRTKILIKQIDSEEWRDPAIDFDEWHTELKDVLNIVSTRDMSEEVEF